MTLIPYDAAHEYTVGAHSLRVVRNLEYLRTTNDARLADYRRISAEVSFPEVLYLAGLIHDVGKQWPQGHHEETGAQAAAEIAQRLGWDRERQDKLTFLVRRHLLMAETSRLRDLALEETVREFVRQVPDMDSLNMLYLLTYADTNAVGAGIWTEVKAKFLSELYGRAEAALTAPPPEPGAEAAAATSLLTRQRERIRKQLQAQNLPPDLIHEHTRSLPAQYLLNTPLEEMYVHIAMIGRLRETFQPIIDFKHEFGTDFTEITVVAYDDPRPGLLAKITGVLYAHDVNVHVAQVFTRESSVRIAIDTLWIDYRGRPLSSGKKDEMQDSLRRVLLGEIGVGELLQKHKKPLKDQSIFTATSGRRDLRSVQPAGDQRARMRRASSTASPAPSRSAAGTSTPHACPSGAAAPGTPFTSRPWTAKRSRRTPPSRLTSLLPAASSGRRKRPGTSPRRGTSCPATPRTPPSTAKSTCTSRRRPSSAPACAARRERASPPRARSACRPASTSPRSSPCWTWASSPCSCPRSTA